MIGTLHEIVVDCADPRALAAFYREVLGADEVEDRGEWVTVGGPGGPLLCFQRVDGYRAPTWPDPAVQSQAHLDVAVADLDEAERAVLALGARRLEGGDGTFRVYADPAGHPLCLVLA